MQWQRMMKKKIEYINVAVGAIYAAFSDSQWHHWFFFSLSSIRLCSFCYRTACEAVLLYGTKSSSIEDSFFSFVSLWFFFCLLLHSFGVTALQTHSHSSYTERIVYIAGKYSGYCTHTHIVYIVYTHIVYTLIDILSQRRIRSRI